MYKAVIFDLDNTICDTIGAIPKSMRVCYKYLKNRYPELDYDKFVSCEQKIFDKLTIHDNIPVYSFRAIYWHEIFKELGLEIDPVAIKDVSLLYSDQLAKNVEIFDGIKEVLDEIKSLGLQIAVLSNGDYTTKVTMLEYSNLINKFDLIVASDLTQADKPSPKAFVYVLKQLGLKVDEVLMVGDERLNDIEAAKYLGIKPVYAAWPTKNNGKSIDGVFTANKPSDILSLLK